VRRLIWDVPRWSLFLHRAARGLHRADPTDTYDRKLEDELFERLFAGEAESLSDHDRDRAFGNWAERIHETVGQLPAFERLAQECRGRADESAMAVEALVNELRPDAQDDGLRRSARAACGKASAAIEELREAMEGLEHVAFGPVPGTSAGTGRDPLADDGVRSLAARLRESARLREIARLAGRFKRIAGAKRRSKVRHSVDEIVDVEQGADLGRLLPLELALLVHPATKRLAMRNLLERSCLQYRLEGNETLGKGPLVVAIDKSGSMEGEKDVWATAVALALLDVAQAEQRPFALLCFDAQVKSESIVLPGEALSEAALFVPADGGTDIDKVVRRGLEIIEQRPGALREADIVLISDGGSNSEDAGELRERAVKLSVTVLGVAIDVESSRLEPWCDQVVAANDMTRVDDRMGDALFGG
jgi:uncharacterized protein with von Willebrand factor type A (vWA) domain